MQLGDLLTQDRIRVPLPASTIAEAVARLLHVLDEGGRGPEGEEEVRSLLRAIEGESRGRILRPTGRTWILLWEDESVGAPEAALGIAPDALNSETLRLEGGRGPRALLLMHLPGPSAISDRALTRLSAELASEATEEALFEAATPVDVRSIRSLMSISLRDRPQVAHALLPIAFRVFPDTPVDEVVDLMARKELSAIPVVGPEMEVLGIITGAEALRYAMEGRGAEVDSPLTAREVMSRTVMCISEQADLADAAKMMVNKEMAQLPVVREGEVVGLLTREAVLKALYGG